MPLPSVEIRGPFKPGDWRRTFRILGTFRPYAGRHRWSLAGALACVLAGTAIRIGQPWPLKFLFDSVLIPYGTGATPPGADFPWTTIAVICGAILALGVSGSLTYYGELVFGGSAGQRIANSLRRTLFGHILTLPLAWHRRTRRGQVMNLLGRDIDHLRELLIDVILGMLSGIVNIAAMLVIMFVLNPRLGLIALAILPLMALASARVSGSMRQVSRKQREREGILLSCAQDVLQAIPAVKLFGQETAERRRFAAVNRRTTRAGLRLKRLEAGLSRRIELLLALATCVFVGVGAYEVWHRHLTAGELLIFASYLKGFQKPLRRVSRNVSRIAKATVCGERIQAVLDEPGEALDAQNELQESVARGASRLAGSVEFQNVSFRYSDDGPWVLRDVSFSVPAGTRVAVVGPSGRGKSTILGLIAQLLSPTHGRILLDGRDSATMSLPEIRFNMTGVFQESHLFHGTVADNLRYGAGDAGDERLQDAAGRAQAWEFISRMPDRLHARIGEQGLTLSGGQRQRMAIARALLRDAPIVLLDEPTTGLDGDSAASVMVGLGELLAGRTAFWATHDLDQVTHCDATLRVDGGRVALETGPPAAHGSDRSQDALQVADLGRSAHA